MNVGLHQNSIMPSRGRREGKERERKKKRESLCLEREGERKDSTRTTEVKMFVHVLMHAPEERRPLEREGMLVTC